MPSNELTAVRMRVGDPLRRTDLIALAQIVAASAGILLCGVAVLFAVRRFAGGVHTPLAPATLLPAVAVLLVVCTALRLPWTTPPARDAAWWLSWVGLLAPLPGSALLAAALAQPQAPPWALVLLWSAVLAHETGWGVWWWRHRQTLRPPTARLSPLRRSDDRPQRADSVPAAEPSELPEQVTQQIVRSSADDGVQNIAGSLRAPFAPDERTGSLHVAFCPPLEDTPTFHCEQIDGPPARITAAEVRSYGVRIDVRLARAASEPTSVLVEFYARGR